MKRFLLAGAAFVALTGFAAAQTSPDAAPLAPAQSQAPAVVITPPPPADAQDSETASEPETMGRRPMMERMRGDDPDRRWEKDKAGKDYGRRHGRMDRDRDMAGDMGRHGRRSGPGRFNHGMRPGSFGEDGARFTFERPGKGKVDIRCASEDSTQECVDAVLPMLQDLLRESAGDNRVQ